MIGGDRGTLCNKLKTSKIANKEHYNCVLSCFDLKHDTMLYKGIGRLKVVEIWETFKLCKFKSLCCKTYGVKTKPHNCASWFGCVKHVENIYYLDDPRDVEEALANPKAHWDSLKESEARKHEIETQYEGQSTLDDCIEEFGSRSAEKKRCITNLVRLCAVENSPLHMGTCARFVEFVR